MSGYYDTDQALAEYLLFHYGDDETVMPWSDGPTDALRFPLRCVERGLRSELLGVPWAERRALDLGCAVGRSSFELARHCGRVIGIDFSARFIQAAQRIATEGALEFPVRIEGDRASRARALRPPTPLGLSISFEVGDALALRRDLGSFEVVLAANLLDRVPRPRALLQGLANRVSPGGQLVLTSPYTWLEEYTPRSEWLVDGGGRPTHEIIADCLAGFRLVSRLDLPFVIREHARKFQWSVAEVTTWIRG